MGRSRIFGALPRTPPEVLRHVILIAEHGSTLAAAHGVKLTASRLGRKIAQLEHELGVTLFERPSRGMRLTPTGHLVAEAARRMTLVVWRALLDLLAQRSRCISGMRGTEETWMRIARGLALLAVLGMLGGTAGAQGSAVAPEDVVRTWYRLVLELVRHTPTMSPPVASRAMGYVGVTGYEAVASGSGSGPGRMVSLAGQVNGLEPGPARAAGAHDEAVVLQAALSASVRAFFGNTGPTGQRAMVAMTDKFGARVRGGVPADVVARSEAYGAAIAAHVLAWAEGDGGAVVENMGFPLEFTPQAGPQYWVPTSLVRQQQAPLLPGWGNNRPFVMPTGNACPLPPPPAYSEEPGSAFHTEALEVVAVHASLTDEQKAIARFWSDDPMLSPTPPGHWMAIAMRIMEEDGADVAAHVDVLARLGMAMSDAFVGCWHTKFEYDLLRPVTYIRRVIDPTWEPLLITPPFPEYPSGHSTQSGAAAAVLTALYGEGYAFTDTTHEDDGLPGRAFDSFWAAADEAGLSRLYGGIHFRAAVERGLDQGRCIGAYVNALKTLED